MAVAEAFVTVRPDLDRFGGDLKSGLGKLTRVAGVAALGITAAIGGAAVAGVRKFAELEQGMNEVFTLLPGISEEAMGALTQDVRDFAVEMGTATEEVVPALYQALSAGVPQDNVFEFLETANKAAIGGITDLETSVDAISSVVNAYGDQIGDATEASDLMFTAVRLGKTTVEELGSSLSNVVPIAAANKVEFGDITAALATMTAQGIPTAEATTQLRQAIVELSDSGSQVGQAFEDVANVSFREFIASGGDMGGAMEILQEAAENSGVSVDQLFGSVEAGSGVLALSGENLDTFRGNIDEMAGSAGATDQAFQTMDEGLARSWERIQTVFGDLILELGERVAPALQSFADWFEENLPGIIDWFERMGGKAEEFGRRLQDWWNDQAKPAIDEFVAAIRDNWPTVEEMFESLGDVVSNIASIFGQELDNMTGQSGESSGSIGEDVTSVLDSLNAMAATAATVSGAVSRSWDILAGAVKMDSGQMMSGLDELSGGALSRFEARFDAGFTRVREGVSRKLGEIVQFFRELPGRITGALGDTWSMLLNAGREIIGGLLAGIRQKWEETAGFLSSLGGRIRDLKGPIEKDRVLLTDIGEEIIGGLGRGMERQWKQIERQLGIMTAEIPTAVEGAPAASGAAPNYHLHVTTGRSEASVMEQFRRMELLYA